MTKDGAGNRVPFPATLSQWKKTLLGFLLILLGFVLLLVQMDILWDDEGVNLFFAGIGLLLVLDYFVRLKRFPSRSPGWFRLLAGVVLIVLFLEPLDIFGDWWPLLLMAIGAGLILFSLRRNGSGEENFVRPAE